jgi:SAM-dependent methyltransferase
LHPEEGMTDANEVKGRKQVAWSAGDYAIIGSRLVIVSELLCEAVDLRANHRVLDVATGHGNTALAAARRGCSVIGIDFAPALLAHARERAAAEHLEISFQDGDADDIPFPAESFDVVLSTFGSEFASEHNNAAAELLRVCRVGGKIGLANWASTGVNVVEGQIIGNYLPPKPDAAPNLWGTQEGVRELFGGSVTTLQIRPRSVLYRFRSAEAYVDTARNTFGPCMGIYESLDEDLQESLKSELVEGLGRFNLSGDETLVLPFDYLEVVATKRR